MHVSFFKNWIFQTFFSVSISDFQRIEVPNSKTVQIIKPKLYFCFIDHSIGDISEASLPNQLHKEFVPTHYSRSFIASCLTLRSMIHFEFTCKVSLVFFFDVVNVCKQILLSPGLKIPKLEL